MKPSNSCFLFALALLIPALALGEGNQSGNGLRTCDGAIMVAAGNEHTVALKSDGTVWTWGYNYDGQLGGGTTTYRNTPVQVVGPGGSGFLTDVIAVAAGYGHTVALKSDGTVWTWGWNRYGQLGDGTTTERHTPVQVVGPGGSGFLTDVIAIAAGGWHTVALKSDGTVWTWGANSDGQLGDGTTTYRNTPIQVVGPGGSGFLTDVVAIAAGGYHTVALKSDGTVWTWGGNYRGQLGDGTIADRHTPVQVVGPGETGFLTDVVAVAAGDYHTVALKSDGTVWTWGDNCFGQLGDGTTDCIITTWLRTTPVQVVGPGGSGFLTDVIAVAAEWGHTVALKSDGTVWTWGHNDFGQLGDETTDWLKTTPVQVLGPGESGVLTDVIAAAAGWQHTVALKSDGTVWTWGENCNGQLGDGNSGGDPLEYNPGIDSNTPVQVLGPGGSGVLTDVIAVAARTRHTVALKSDGTVWTWGNNDFGQLGDGTTIDRHPPVHQVVGPGGTGFLTDVIAVAAGDGHTVALKSDGTVWTWGDNEDGQLGDGTTINRHTPVQVVGLGGTGFLTDVIAVAAGDYHTVALKSDGTVWTWGDNYRGQLGDGTRTDRHTPVQVLGLTDVIAVAAGDRHTVALKSDGTVWTWGDNYYGQLGDGNSGGNEYSYDIRIDSSTPVQVVGPGGSGYLTDVIAVAAGWGYTVALKSDGTVWAWGYNEDGQLGDGTTTNRNTPVQVVGPGGSGFLTDVIAIAAGDFHTVALKSDGTVWTWGANGDDQLGDGTWTDSPTPVQVVGPGGSGFLTDVIAVAAGGEHTVALKSDGTVWTCGNNYYHQLGDGMATDRYTPVHVVGPGGSGFLTDVVAVAAGGWHTVALKSDGTVWTWGNNGYGQLGDETITNSPTPVQALLPK